MIEMNPKRRIPENGCQSLKVRTRVFEEGKRVKMSFQTKCSSIGYERSVGNEEEGREGVENLNRLQIRIGPKRKSMNH